ncbi:hypothetical protein D9758_004274 [Tetrapyrgos nigripes]|uniref:Fe2OG dioxygenase domain-containing protein n=1 Tax=Tetrapyrgos nigripes TaxID=182062 RepID=A0A8H5GU85_9AGAR|nr:hypothetical protein D9758_004274 [Tetrapyrgos nigripes]
MTLSSPLSTSQANRKRKLSVSDHEQDPILKRRNAKGNPSLRVEIPTASQLQESAYSDVESGVSGADSLFDDIFDDISFEVGEDIVTTSTATTGLNTSLDSSRPIQLPSISPGALPPSLIPSAPAVRSLRSLSSRPSRPSQPHHDPNGTPSDTPSSPKEFPIPGLFFNPSILIPQELASEVVEFCMKTYFSGRNANVNQVMLFGRSPTSSSTPAVPASRPSPSSTKLKENEDDDTDSQGYSGLPPILQTLLSHISTLLLPHLPPTVHSLYFPTAAATATSAPATCSSLSPPLTTTRTTRTIPPTSSTQSTPSPNLNRARQAIINLYHPGEGITPHVDLLRRFGDGIVGVSFGSGCVMEFRRVGDHPHDGLGDSEISESYAVPSGAGSSRGSNGSSDGLDDAYDLYLPERSVLAMSGDARYKWTHGIPRRKWDCVEEDGEGGVDNVVVGVDTGGCPGDGELLKDTNDDSGSGGRSSRGTWLERGTRLSITFRFLLPGAEIVGEED